MMDEVTLEKYKMQPDTDTQAWDWFFMRYDPGDDDGWDVGDKWSKWINIQRKSVQACSALNLTLQTIS